MRAPRRAVTALVVVATTALTATLAGAAAPPVSAQRAVLPAGGTGIASGLLTTLACPAAGQCEAGGSYTGPGHGVFGVVLNERHGRWTAPSVLGAPADAAPGNPGTTVASLSCPALGRCVAGGSYSDGAGDVHAFLADQSGNAWPRAHTVPLPAGALGSGQDAAVRSVACGAPGDCVAVGTYLDDAPVPRSLAFVDLERGGTWSAASEVALPTPANADPFTTLSQVACATATRCVAVGSFVDARGVTQGLAVTVDAGAVTSSVVSPPSDASTYAGTSLAEVTCVHEGPCTAVGTYYDAAGAIEPLAVSSASPVWPEAGAIELPVGARANPHVLLYGYAGISCPASGDCATGGQYVDASGRYQGFLATESGGQWHRATRMPMPAGARSGGANGGVVAVACPSAGRCRAGGAFLDGSGRYQALVVTEHGATWTGAPVRLPAGATTVGVDGGLYALACPTAAGCVGIGSYERGASYQGFTLRA